MVEPKIQPNQQFFVKGSVQFSDVSQLVDGARLEALNANSEYQRKPYTGVTVMNPKIVNLSGKKTETEQAVENKRFYQSKHDDVLHFQGTRSKYPNAKRPYELPWIAVGDLATKHVTQVKLHKGEEISRGRNVILCMRTFKGQGRPGMILDGVIVPLSPEENKTNLRAAFESSENRNIDSELSSTLDTKDLPKGLSSDTATETEPAPAPAETAQTESNDQDPWADFGDDTADDSSDDSQDWFKS